MGKSSQGMSVENTKGTLILCRDFNQDPAINQLYRRKCYDSNMKETDM